ncbi:MAG: glycosyltransferase [Planctomycetes bacterium]|nr:glycosyltransferase [Planctomycetota bacterium]
MSGTSWTDLGFDEAILRANLEALARHRPDLARVLEGAGVHDAIVVARTAEGPRVHRLFRRQPWRVEEDPAELERPAAVVEGLADARDEILCGVGLGERLEPLLAGLLPGGRLLAHESDPALMTLALARRDLSSALAEGRLLPYLGAGIRRQALPPIRRLHRHPLLGPLRFWDRRQLEGRLAGQDARTGSPPVEAGRTAVVLLGELLQEECARALEAEGFEIYRLDGAALTPEQIARELAILEPALAFSINFRPELGSLGGRFGFPYLCWEIDPTASTLPLLRRGDRAREACRVFTWRRRRVALFEEAGYQKVEFLPLAADPAARSPEPDRSARAAEAPELLFVGSCMREQARRHRETLDQLAARSGPARAGWERFLADLDRLALQVRAEPCRQDYEDLLRGALEAAGLPEWLQTPEGEMDLVVVAGESLAAEKRVALARGLCDLGLVVRGEEAWAEVLPTTNYGGPAGHGRELTALYAGAAINLDMNRLYQPDIVTLRVFEVAVAGGFVISEDTAEIRELFEEGREIALYRNLDDLRTKLRHYLGHEDERRAMAGRLRARVLAEHRVDQRIRRMIERSGPLGGR